MTQLEKDTELKILEAAKFEFIEKGFDGARMQKIAERAGINKALLHYYFRSKENLFKGIFREAFGEFIPKIMATFQSNLPFEEKLRGAINSYIDLFIKNPHLPVFVINEMHRNPTLIPEIILSEGAKPEYLMLAIGEELKKMKVKHITPVHLIVNILSMCIFPFAAAPILTGVIFKNNKAAYQQFIQERKQIVFDFIMNSLKSK
jgi:TetR/AcrR family transcriptional regulator